MVTLCLLAFICWRLIRIGLQATRRRRRLLACGVGGIIAFKASYTSA